MQELVPNGSNLEHLGASRASIRVNACREGTRPDAYEVTHGGSFFVCRISPPTDNHGCTRWPGWREGASALLRLHRAIGNARQFRRGATGTRRGLASDG